MNHADDGEQNNPMCSLEHSFSHCTVNDEGAEEDNEECSIIKRKKYNGSRILHL